MSVKNHILNILFPQKCPFCGKILEPGHTDLCETCKTSLPYRPEGKVKERINGFDCAVTFYYEDTVKDGIRSLKFRRISTRAAAFAPYLAQTVAEHLGGEFDAVTFVPISRWRNFTRGFDQSQLLASETAKVWSVRAEKILVKVRNNPPQSSVKTPAERRANVLGAYRVRKGASVRGRRFLLIDDVVTTGSTMTECAALLMEAGAQSVVCAALAGGKRRSK